MDPNRDPRLDAIPDVHGHTKGEHKPFAEERPIPYTARMLFLWFYHACRRGAPRFMMVSDHVNYLTFEDPSAVNLVRRAIKLAHAGDLYGAADTAGVDLVHASVVSEGLRRGMRYSIGAEVDNDPRNRPDAQNIVDAMRPDAIIRSVHFLTVEHSELPAGYLWPFDNAEFKDVFKLVGTERVWELYMAALLEAVEKLPGHIVGHFYVPAKFGDWPDEAALERYEDQILAACAERGFAIELNTRTFYCSEFEDDGAWAEQRRKYYAANLRLLKKAKAAGVAVAVGSDAHSPKDQSGGFETALELLDQADINEIAFPTNGRIARVALRATEELLRAAAPPAPEPLPEPPPGAVAAPAATAPARSAKPKGTSKPAAAKAPAKPAAAKPAEPKPAAPKPAASKAAEPKPTAPKPAAPKPAASKPAASKPAASKPVPAKPVAPKPVPAKPVAPKPAPAKPRTERGARAPGETPARPAAKAPAKPVARPKPAPRAKAAPRPAARKAATAARKKAGSKAPAAKSGARAKKSDTRTPAKRGVKAAPKRPAAKRPAAKRAAPKKPAVRKTAAKKPAPKKPAKQLKKKSAKARR